MAGPPVPISSLIVEDWFHGLHTALVFLTLWVIYTSPSQRETNKTANFTIVILVMYACSTVHCGLQWFYYSHAIDDNELPGGPGLLFSLSHLEPWIEAVGSVSFILNILIADVLFIWRAWIVWQRRWIIIILPVIMTLCGVALSIRFLVALVTLETSGDAFTSIKKMQDVLAFSTAYIVLSIATSLLTTFFLALRITLVQRASFKATGRRSSTLSAAIEIPVESAALYSLSMLTYVILNVTKNPNAFYAQNIHAQVTGIAPTLIILRVVAGHSRPDSGWSISLDPSVHSQPRKEPKTRVLSAIQFFRPSNTVNTASAFDQEDGQVTCPKDRNCLRDSNGQDASTVEPPKESVVETV